MTTTGVLGRMLDVLSKFGHNVRSFSIDHLSAAVTGEVGAAKSHMVMSRNGVTRFYVSDAIQDVIGNLFLNNGHKVFPAQFI